MSQTAETPSQRVEPDDVRQQLAGKHACPFCGVIRADPQQPCPRCTMEDTGATRGATRQRIGPWFVLQARNPSAPGMKFATLLQLVKKGHVTPRSIVRGPTSQQLWTFAAKLRGLSREFGLCCHCGEGVEPTSMTCGQCGYSQDLPANPDTLFEPPEVTPPDIMEGSKSPADTGMDGGVSLDLQVSDLPGGAGAAPSLRPVKPAALEPAALESIAPAFSVAPASTVAPMITPAFPAAASASTPSASTQSTSPAIVPIPVRPLPRPAAPSNLPAVAPRRMPTALAAAPQPSEGILSARELAAAFQLDFKPKGEKKGDKQGPVFAGGSTAPKRKGSLLRTIFALFLIMVASAAITLLLRPDWRAIVFKAANDKFASVKTTLEKPAPKPGASTPAGKAPGASPKPVPSAMIEPPAPTFTPAPKPVDITPPAPAPAPAPQVEANPVPQPAAPVEAAPKPPVNIVTAPAPEPVPAPKADPTPTPPPPTPPVAVAPVPVPPAPAAPAPAPPAPAAIPTDKTDIDSLTLDQAIDKASEWRNQAIDASARGDWAGAVMLYERIEKLPKDAWPSDVELKLEIARKRAGG